MSDFKLIAIRPRKMSPGISERFLKVLTPNVIYKFYNNYKFHTVDNKQDGAVTNIICEKEVLNIYGNQFTSKKNKLTINISAIVGKNGSGKSTLVELLYLAIFNVSKKLDVLPKQDDEGDTIKYQNGIHLEFYYKRDAVYYKVLIENKDIKFYYQEGESGMFSESLGWQDKGKQQLMQLFYSIVINYSHYALNSANLGSWIKNIFHKNDAYQTPIVLNPFRKLGNISINEEEFLTFSRVLTNLLVFSDNEISEGGSNNKSVRELAPGKTVEKIKLKLNISKSRFKNEEKYPDLKKIWDELIKKRDDILDLIFEVFPIKNKPKTYDPKSNSLFVAYDYLLKKLYTMHENYRPLQRSDCNFLIKIDTSEPVKEGDEVVIMTEKYEILLPELKNFLNELSSYNSHITLKFRQAINYIQNFGFYEKFLEKYNDKFFPIDELAIEIKKIREENKELIELIPPSFFDIDIKFKDKGNFNALSSGEKQKIYSSASVIYHLINLNSVKNVKPKRHEDPLNYFECVNIVFDEVELYYHPDLQRTFINDLLFNIRKLHIPNIKSINCIFVTHSPFILSDIPSENILLLNEEGIPETIEIIGKTFAANMHDILQKSFFLKNGYMGEIAKSKINSAMQFLKNEVGNSADVWNKNSINEFIEIVSEPMIRLGLRDLYYKKFLTQETEIDKEIELLRKLKEKNIKK